LRETTQQMQQVPRDLADGVWLGEEDRGAMKDGAFDFSAEAGD